MKLASMHYRCICGTVIKVQAIVVAKNALKCKGEHKIDDVSKAQTVICRSQ